MPIKVQCTCGKTLTAKDELAGKTVKCPGCQQPLKIPGGSAAPAKAAATATGKPATAKAPKPAPAKPAPAVDDAFDEIGLAPVVANTKPCPGCTQPMALDAVICLKCGYNTRIGRKMETQREGGEEHVGHGAVAADLMSKAADVIEGDEDAEAQKTTEGLPWWVYLIFLLALVGLATFMLMRSGGDEKDKEKKGYLAPTSVTLPA